MLNLLAQAKLTNPVAPKLSPATTDAGSTSLSNLVAVLVGWLFTLGLLLFIFFFLINAIKWISSSGDKNSVETARQGILHALIGVIVPLSLFAILKLIESVFHVCVLQITLPVFGETSSRSCGGIGGGNQSTNPAI